MQLSRCSKGRDRGARRGPSSCAAFGCKRLGGGMFTSHWKLPCPAEKIAPSPSTEPLSFTLAPIQDGERVHVHVMEWSHPHELPPPPPFPPFRITPPGCLLSPPLRAPPTCRIVPPGRGNGVKLVEEEDAGRCRRRPLEELAHSGLGGPDVLVEQLRALDTDEPGGRGGGGEDPRC